jgi:hypothetical protein
MKESVLDVLMYLFEHYFDEEAELESDQESLRAELVDAGFPEAEISKAFAWLEGLTMRKASSSRSLALVQCEYTPHKKWIGSILRVADFCCFWNRYAFLTARLGSWSLTG